MDYASQPETVNTKSKVQLYEQPLPSAGILDALFVPSLPQLHKPFARSIHRIEPVSAVDADLAWFKFDSAVQRDGFAQLVVQANNDQHRFSPSRKSTKEIRPCFLFEQMFKSAAPMSYLAKIGGDGLHTRQLANALNLFAADGSLTLQADTFRVANKSLQQFCGKGTAQIEFLSLQALQNAAEGITRPSASRVTSQHKPCEVSELLIRHADETLRKPIIGTFADIVSDEHQQSFKLRMALERTSAASRLHDILFTPVCVPNNWRQYASLSPRSHANGQWLSTLTKDGIGALFFHLLESSAQQLWTRKLNADQISLLAQNTWLGLLQQDTVLDETSWLSHTGAQDSVLPGELGKVPAVTCPAQGPAPRNMAPASSPQGGVMDMIVQGSPAVDSLFAHRHHESDRFGRAGLNSPGPLHADSQQTHSGDGNAKGQGVEAKFVISDELLQFDSMLQALCLHLQQSHAGFTRHGCLVERHMPSCLHLLADETSAAHLVLVPQHIDENTEATFLRKEVTVLQDLVRNGIGAACIIVAPQSGALTRSVFSICAALGTICHSLPLKAYTRVGSSDETTAAILASFIRQSQARAGASTEGDMTFDDWARRPWLTRHASCHERFLAKCPGLNCVTAQVLLSVWPLREVLTLPLGQLAETVTPPQGLVSVESLRLFCEWRDLNRHCLPSSTLLDRLDNVGGAEAPVHNGVHFPSGFALQAGQSKHADQTPHIQALHPISNVREDSVSAMQSLLRTQALQPRPQSAQPEASHGHVDWRDSNGPPRTSGLSAKINQSARYQDSSRLLQPPEAVTAQEDAFLANWVTPKGTSIHNAGDQPLHKLKARRLALNSEQPGQSTLHWRQPSIADAKSAQSHSLGEEAPRPAAGDSSKDSNVVSMKSQLISTSHFVSSSPLRRPHAAQSSGGAPVGQRSKYFAAESPRQLPQQADQGHHASGHSSNSAASFRGEVQSSQWTQFHSTALSSGSMVAIKPAPLSEFGNARSTPQLMAEQRSAPPLVQQGAGGLARVSAWRDDGGALSSVRAVLQARQALRKRNGVTARRRASLARR